MTKVLVEVYFTYGKQDGIELHESYVTNDTAGLREELYDYWTGWSTYVLSNADAFKNGETNELLVDASGGDWDDPTGREIYITSYATKKDEIERQYKRDLEILNKQFEEETKYMSETVTISKEDYDQLKEDQAFLNALEEAGVDNWEGYAEAWEIYEGEDE